ncbi:hypothetical protein LCM00_13610 [Bacillus infantis]|uniref:hypothetical protein n=1 Tax=Bacillus infantis TaxID=324767 RepID=UPI001CD5C225|nr:hypothetical protein [Bacillus infantis]MCA1040545.1 hypothetical protein [Bacillus infantis]
MLVLVWLANIRPGSYIIDQMFKNPSPSIPQTAKSAIDVAILASIIAYLSNLWKPPIEISTKLVNIDTRRNHSTFTGENPQAVQNVWLEINMKVKTGKWVNWNKVLCKIGGFYLSLKENSFVGYQFDSQQLHPMIVTDKGVSKIHLFKGSFEVSETAELQYIVYCKRTALEVRTAELITTVESTHNNIFMNFISKFLLSQLLKVENGKHNVFFN